MKKVSVKARVLDLEVEWEIFRHKRKVFDRKKRSKYRFVKKTAVC